MLLYIIRHGAPDYAKDCLLPRGKLQAEALSHRLCLQGFDRIYSSPLGRAQETAQPTCDVLGMPMEILEWTSEDLAWKQMSIPDPKIGRRWCWGHIDPSGFINEHTLAQSQDWFDLPCFAGTDVRGCWNRVSQASDGFLEGLGYRNTGASYEILRPSEERVAVFCHEGFGTVWLSWLLHIPLHQFCMTFGIALSSITILDFHNFENGFTSPRCLTLSDTSHLYGSRLPVEHNNGVKL